MIEYLETLKRAHNHPKQRKIRFTQAEKIEILWKLANQLKPAEWLNKKLGLPHNSITTFNIQLRNGDLGIGHSELVKALTERIGKLRRKEHLTQAS